MQHKIQNKKTGDLFLGFFAANTILSIFQSTAAGIAGHTSNTQRPVYRDNLIIAQKWWYVNREITFYAWWSSWLFIFHGFVGIFDKIRPAPSFKKNETKKAGGVHPRLL